MKKGLGVSKAILLLFISSILLSACSSKENLEWKRYDALFVDAFSNENDIETFSNISLSAYYDDEHYYYVVRYDEEGLDFSPYLLYIFQLYSLNIFFPIQDEAECYEYSPVEYSAFIRAQQEGVCKEYTDAEIAEMINSFYGRVIFEVPEKQ